MRACKLCGDARYANGMCVNHFYAKLIPDTKADKSRFTRQTIYSIGVRAKLLQEQGQHCAICPAPVQDTRAHLDHCHASGAIRGILCHPCNVSLGYYERHQRPAGLVIAPYEAYLAYPPFSKLERR